MIEPSVGRIVWVFHTSGKPLAGIITSVISNEEITVTVFDIGSERHQKLPLLQTDADYKGETPYATWMPYQKGQAAKTEALEKAMFDPMIKHKPNSVTYEKASDERPNAENKTHTFKE